MISTFKKLTITYTFTVIKTINCYINTMNKVPRAQRMINFFSIFVYIYLSFLKHKLILFVPQTKCSELQNTLKVTVK